MTSSMIVNFLSVSLNTTYINIIGQHILRVTTKLKINHSRKQKIDPIFDNQTANYEGQSEDKVHEEICSHAGKICWNCH